jgi:hypothetical protein
VRTTGVRLVAQLTQFKREFRDGAKVTRDLKDQVDDTATASDRLGDELGRTAKSGKKDLDELRAHAANLDGQIRNAEAGLRSLAQGFANTGDLDLLKAFKDQRKVVNNLKGVRKAFGDVGAQSATAFADRFGTLLAPALRTATAHPAVAAAVVGIGLVAAPAIGATISGAIIGGVGVGGVVGGMVLASKDVRVRQAAEAFGDRLEERLFKAGGAFVPAALDGLKQLEKSLDSIDLEGALADSADLAPLLTQGIAKALTALGVGIRSLVANAGPAVAAIGDGIARIGQAIGDGMLMLSDNGVAAAEALRVLFGVIAESIMIVFRLVNMMTELWEVAKKLGGDTTLALFLKVTGMGMDENSVKAKKLTAEERILEEETKRLAEEQEKLAEKQQLVSRAQQGLQGTMQLVSAESLKATMASQQLKTAMDALFGAAIRQTDANEAYQASWDSLSESVKKNGRSLDIHTKAGRTNRDALQDLLTKSGELYLADIASGMAIDAATAKHTKRTAQIRKEAGQSKLNKAETDRLISTYGRIPPRKSTDLILQGVNDVADALLDLAQVQLHLSKGTPLGASLSRRLARAQYGMPDTKRAHGGPLPGHAPHDRADNAVFAGTPGEWVIQRPTVRQVERRPGAGAKAYFNKYGELPAFASGGLLRASRASWGDRDMDYRVTTRMTKVPTMQQAIAAVPFMMGGNWPSSPGAQRGDSGVWRAIVRMIRATGPMSGAFGNAYRHGDPKWHGSGRAVDWMGFNQDRLATFLANRRPLELIHRTRNRDYAYTRGRNMGSFNNSLMEAHRNHIHIAMQNGGMIREPVFGVGASGATYSFGENGVHEKVIPMAGGNSAGMAGTVFHVTIGAPITIHGGNQSPHQIAAQVNREIGAQFSQFVRGIT